MDAIVGCGRHLAVDSKFGEIDRVLTLCSRSSAGLQRGTECQEGRGTEGGALFRAFMKVSGPGMPKHRKRYQVFSPFCTLMTGATRRYCRRSASSSFSFDLISEPRNVALHIQLRHWWVMY
jgi:hypothetical protein